MIIELLIITVVYDTRPTAKFNDVESETLRNASASQLWLDTWLLYQTLYNIQLATTLENNLHIYISESSSLYEIDGIQTINYCINLSNLNHVG